MDCIEEVFEHLPVPFVIFSPGWRILGFNRAFTSFIGLSEDEIKSSSPFLYGIKPSEHGSIELMGTGRALGEQLKFGTFVRIKDGTIMPVNVYLGEVRDGEGGIANYYAVVEPERVMCDIPVPNMPECMTDPVILVDGNADVTFANREALDMLKKDASSVLGKKLIDLYRRPSYTLFYKKLTYCMDERRPSGLEDFDPRLNRWYDIRFYPCGEDTIAHFRDISLRKHQDWWLRMTTFALDRVREPVLLTDSGGRILYTNAPAAEALGYKKDEIRAMKIFDVLKPMSADVWSDTVRMATEKGSAEIDVSLTGRGGTAIPAKVAAYYVKFFNVEYLCIVVNTAS